MISAAAGLANGLGNGLELGFARKARKEAAAREQEALDLRRRELDAAASAATFSGGGDWRGGGRGVSRGDGSNAPYDVSSDPVADGLSGPQMAFLNAVSGGESGGRYNVRYTPSGGASFDGYDRHPGIAEQGPHGPSTAAGRYQFTQTTWNSMGGGAFTPEQQDRRALELARRDYRARTGRDFDADLEQNGLTDGMMAALSPTWAALGSNRGRHAATYRASLDRYGAAATPSAPAQAAAAETTTEQPTGWAAIRRAMNT